MREVAIVTDTAGTTRDVIEVRLDLGGYAVLVADTAGLRTAGDTVEAEGIRRAVARARTADLALVRLDATAGAGMEPEVAALLADGAAGRLPVLVAVNKTDAAPVAGPNVAGCGAPIPLSVRTGAGCPELIDGLERAVRERLGS